MTDKVLAVVLNYNGILLTKDLFLKSIESIQNQNYLYIDILVIDNHSTDQSVKIIREKFPDIKIIITKSNLGTMGYNEGISEFLKNDYTHILLCNNDILFDSNFVKSMVEYGNANPKAGILTSKMMMLDDNDKCNSTGIIINKSGFAYDRDFGKRRAEADKRISGRVFAGSGGAMFCSRDAVERTGYFDPIYYAYYEDVDFSTRMMRKTEYSTHYVDNAVCYHAFSKSWGESDIKEFYMIRNRMIFILIHFPLKQIISSLKFLFFNIRHKNKKMQRKTYFSIFTLIFRIKIRRIKMLKNMPIPEEMFENYKGLPKL